MNAEVVGGDHSMAPGGSAGISGAGCEALAAPVELIAMAEEEAARDEAVERQWFFPVGKRLDEGDGAVAHALQ